MPTAEHLIAIILAIDAGEPVEYQFEGSKWCDFTGNFGEFLEGSNMYNWRLKPAPPKPRSVWVSGDAPNAIGYSFAWWSDKGEGYTEFREVLADEPS